MPFSHYCSFETDKPWETCGFAAQMYGPSPWKQTTLQCSVPDNKVHGANMWPTRVLSAPDGPHVGPMSLVSGVISLWLSSYTEWALAMISRILIVQDGHEDVVLTWTHFFRITAHLRQRNPGKYVVSQPKVPLKYRYLIVYLRSYTSNSIFLRVLVTDSVQVISMVAMTNKKSMNVVVCGDKRNPDNFCF